ncbi:DUF4365 domain-containing protein [Patescibacteria group bacterium]|nr:DUF4365 domain-containing protein [Patescibacteria group bacterium]
MKKDLPKYIDSKRKGNIGESFVQYLLSEFCLVHKIDGSMDIGNDFICELIRDQYPTNLLFYVQVKYTQNEPHLKKSTIKYWEGSPIPVYLFWLKDKPIHLEDLSELKYKRYTPQLHNEKKHLSERYKPWYRYDFFRDLIIDYVRCQYIKGSATIIEPRDFLKLEDKMTADLPMYIYAKDVIKEYSDKILGQGWINLYTTALLLRDKDTIEDLKNALSLIKIAKNLFKYKRSDNGNFIDNINEQEREIDHLIKQREGTNNLD